MGATDTDNRQRDERRGALSRVGTGARRAKGAVRRKARDVYFERQCRHLLHERAGGSLHDIFGDADDRLWRWVNIDGRDRVAGLRGVLPDLPEDRVQQKFTGNAGATTLGEGFRFVQLVREMADRHHEGGFAACRNVLDFGCGWGRIIRFWLKDVEPSHLTGLDCLPQSIETCQSMIPGVRFDLVDPYGPSALTDGSVDLISSFSVFSHLSEPAHRAWLDEFHRILRPGGLLVATTWPRDFIDECATYRRMRDEGKLPFFALESANAFTETDEWHARYDRGEYCYAAVGGGEGLDADFCGETLIAEAYVAREWGPQFELREYVADKRRCQQNVIIARRR